MSVTAAAETILATAQARLVDEYAASGKGEAVIGYI